MKKQHLLLTIIFIIGILIGKVAFSTNEVIVRTETVPIKSFKDKQLDSLAEGFYNISQAEFTEYIKLKDERAKAEKAEEILGKVILLFLANVQMKMKPDVKKYFSTPKTSSHTEVSIKSKNGGEALVKNKDGLWQKKGPEVFLNDNKKSNLVKIENEEFKGIQKQLPFEISNPYYYYKNAKPFTKLDNIEKFNGSFSGSLLFVNGEKKNQVHLIKLNINFSDDGNKISGTYESKISFEGKLYSHNRGNGGNRQIRKAAKGLYLVETSPNSFLHLNYISSGDYFVGKYYDDDEYVGLVRIYPDPM